MSTLTTEDKVKKSKISRGWLIVAACMLMQAIPYSIAASLQPQFISYVTESLGFTLVGFSMLFSIGTVMSAVASPFIGKAFSKFNPKHVYILGVLLACGSFAGYSLCTELWQFYILACTLQTGAAMISTLGIPVLVNAWFDEESKGKALGLAFAGGSIGNIFLQSLIVTSLDANGWQASYKIFGIVGLVVGLLVAIFLIRMPKNNDEVVHSAKTDKKQEENAVWGFTFAEVKKKKSFWILTLGFFFVGIYVASLSVQFAAYLKSINIDPKLLAAVSSTWGVCCLFGNLVGGSIFDKLGAVKSFIAASICVALAILSLIFAPVNHYIAFGFSVFSGLAVFVYMIGPALLVGSLLGNKDYANILGIVNLIFGVGFALGSTIFGMLVSGLGYKIAWIVILIASVFAFTCLILSSKQFAKLKATSQAEEVAA